MMNKLPFLLLGELSRLKKYRVITVNVLVSLVWLATLYFIEDQQLLNQLLPLILMLDVTMMAALFVGATMFFEKSEQTIATMLVTPTSHHQQIWAKVIANTIHMLVGSLIIALIFYFVRHIDINFFYLVITLILSTVFHSILGFVLAYFSKEFTSMLMLVMAYSLVFMIPSILYQFNILFVGDIWPYVLLLSPNQAVLNLVTSSLNGVFNLESWLSLSVLILDSGLLYVLFVAPYYQRYAIKASGV